jgi:hypothetical protein
MEFRTKNGFKPVRDRNSIYYLSKEMYPMDEFPPFALGNFYVLSENLVRYLVENRQNLQIMGSLEDLTIGYWLFSLKVLFYSFYRLDFSLTFPTLGSSQPSPWSV